MTLEEPWARFAASIDLGGPGGTIHPERKREIGRRAAAEYIAMDRDILDRSAPAISSASSGPMLNPSKPLEVRASWRAWCAWCACVVCVVCVRVCVVVAA